MPPEDTSCHVSANLVNPMTAEFDLENFAAEEKMMLDEIASESQKELSPVKIQSTGPVEAVMDVEDESKTVNFSIITAFFTRSNTIDNYSEIF